MTKTDLSTRTRRGFWLMGMLVLILATLFPSRSFVYGLLIDDLNLKSLSPFLMNYYPLPGGLVGQALNYMQLAGANSASAGDFLVAFGASCLVTLSLTLCVMFFWRWLVDRKPHPSLVRVLLAVLAAVGSSLVLTLILFFCGYSPLASFMNKESQVLTFVVAMFILFIAQLCFIPILFIAGTILVKWQGWAERRGVAQAS